MTKILFFLVFIFSCVSILSQGFQVKGQVADASTNQFLSGTNIILISQLDSTTRGTASGNNGKFVFEKVRPSVYQINISFVGYKTYTYQFSLKTGTIDFGILYLSPSPIQTEEIKIIGKIKPVVLKKDTVEYNSDAFKIRIDATAEDLLKKMPGIDIKGSSVLTQGKVVKKVVVDGKPFISENPKTVLKNIPAEMIEKVQVYNDKDDADKNSSTEEVDPTINLVTRKKFREGTFGKFSAGIGTNKRYTLMGNLNVMKDFRRVSISVDLNNINSFVFEGTSVEDLETFTGSFGGTLNRKSLSAFYSETISEDFSVLSNLSASKQEHLATSSRDILYNEFDNGQFYKETNEEDSKRIDNSFKTKFSFNIDSSAVIVFTPKVGYAENKSASENGGLTFDGNTLINTSSSRTASQFYSRTFGGACFFSKKFQKEGRNFVALASLNKNYSNTNADLSAENSYFEQTTFSNTVNQNSNTVKRNMTLYSMLKYIEPIDSAIKLELGVELFYDQTEQNKRSYDRISGTFEDAFSSVYTNNNLSNYFNAGIIVNTEHFSLNAKISNAINVINYNQTVPKISNVNKEFNSLRFTVRYSHHLSAHSNFDILINSREKIPNAYLLEYEVDNSNSLKLTTGNPALEPIKNNNISFIYLSKDIENFSSLRVALDLGMSPNYLGTNYFYAQSDTTILHNVFLKKGTSISFPDNVGEYYNVRGFIIYSLPVDWLSSKITTGINSSYSKTPVIINNNKSETEFSSISGNYEIHSSLSSYIDFSFGGDSEFRMRKQNGLLKNDNEFSQSTFITLYLTIWSNLNLSTSINYNYSNSLPDDDKNVYFINAGLGYKFLKDKSLSLNFSVNDLLNQNKNIKRNINELYTENYTSNKLGRYFLLTLSYSLKIFPNLK